MLTPPQLATPAGWNRRSHPNYMHVIRNMQPWARQPSSTQTPAGPSGSSVTTQPATHAQCPPEDEIHETTTPLRAQDSTAHLPQEENLTHPTARPGAQGHPDPARPASPLDAKNQPTPLPDAVCASKSTEQDFLEMELPTH